MACKTNPIHAKINEKQNNSKERDKDNRYTLVLYKPKV